MLFKPVSDNFSGFLFTKKKKKDSSKQILTFTEFNHGQAKGAAPVAAGSGTLSAVVLLFF